MTTTVSSTCTACPHVYNPVKDAPFLVLNHEGDEAHYRAKAFEEGRSPIPPRYTEERPELAFCSTECLARFVKQPAHYDLLARLEPAQLTLPEPGAKDGQGPSFLRYAHKKRWEDTLAGNLSCACDVRVGGLLGTVVTCVQGQAPLSPCRHGGHGPFFTLYQPFDGNHWKDVRFNGLPCLLDWCWAAAYDAKGWWERPELKCPRCAHCQSVYRRDLFGGGSGAISVKALVKGVETRVTYCQPSCFLAALEAGLEVRWLDFQTAFAPHGSSWKTGCYRCEKEDRNSAYVSLKTCWESAVHTDEVPACFCSKECLVAAFSEDRASFERRGLDKWYVTHDHPLRGLPH